MTISVVEFTVGFTSMQRGNTIRIGIAMAILRKRTLLVMEFGRKEILQSESDLKISVFQSTEMMEKQESGDLKLFD